MFVKKYPYLQTNFSNDNLKQTFLESLDTFISQKRYVLITVLNWDEEPIKEIQGECTGGSITKDGKSTIRRTGNISFVTDDIETRIEDLNYIFSINKKIYIEIGIENNSDQYLDYPILWFPQGIFIITNYTCNSSAESSVEIALSLSDKMSLLNGDAGGNFISTTVLDVEDTQEKGAYIEKKTPIFQIIQEILHHFGKESLNNILIEDIPLKAKQVMKWVGSSPLYLVPQDYEGNVSVTYYQASLTPPADMTEVLVKEYGSDVGYEYVDFVYPNELIAQAGETITSILDKIKNTLGNYEYFYDEFGFFHFRQIKNYLNTSYSSVLLDKLGESSTSLFTGNFSAYEIELANPSEVYSFQDNINITSISKNLNYLNIKNDYVIHGLRKNTLTGVDADVFYHLVIDRKPVCSEHSDILLYKEKAEDYTKATVPLIITFDPNESNNPGIIGMIYYNDNTQKVYYWDGEMWQTYIYVYFYKKCTPIDWRTELYYQGLEAQKNGTSSNRYFAELEAFWPQMYNLETNRFYGEEQKGSKRVQSLCDGNYFLDFIDSPEIETYNINNMGIRSLVINNEEINCLFSPEIPDLIFLNILDEDLEEKKAECRENNQPWTQVSNQIYTAMAVGGYYNPAYDQIKYELYNHTNYASTVNLNIIPNYYLEPNSRVRILDRSTNTYGDYLIQSLNLSLDPIRAGTITCNEFIDRNSNGLKRQNWRAVLNQGSWGNIKDSSWQKVYEG